MTAKSLPISTQICAKQSPVKTAFFAIALANLMLPSIALAVPEIVVNDPATGQPLANQPQSVTGSIMGVASSVSATAPTPSPMANPNQPTLAQMNMPNDSQLSQANTKLLTSNAELQRQVNSLTTQVNVLINERSGQLFMFGVLTAFASLLAGLGLGWVMFGRNKGRW